MFSFDSWTRFVDTCFKAFPRYVRDQCIEGKKYFYTTNIEIAILQEAVNFCLSNDTVSFKNLHDTYSYYLIMWQESKDIFESHPQGPVQKVIKDDRKVNVKRRNFAAYQAIINKKGVRT